MSRQCPNLAWRFYDEQFRQTKACQPIPWGAPLGYLYLRCMSPKHQIGRSMPFRPQQEWSPCGEVNPTTVGTQSGTAGLSKRENSATGPPVHTNICAVGVTGNPKPSVERLPDHSGNRQAISPSPYPAGDKTHTPLPSPINVQALEALLVGYDTNV